MAERRTELGEVLAQPRRGLGRRDRQHQSADQRADPGSDEGVAVADERAATAPEISEVPEHEHVDEHRERLDRELRHREIRRAEQQERRRHAVADHAEREHRRHGGLGERRRDRSGDDDHDDQHFVQPHVHLRRDRAEPWRR